MQLGTTAGYGIPLLVKYHYCYTDENIYVYKFAVFPIAIQNVITTESASFCRNIHKLFTTPAVPASPDLPRSWFLAAGPLPHDLIELSPSNL